MENKGINLLLSAFITLILGIVLIGVYADQSEVNVNLKTATETFDISAARSVALGNINNSYVFTVANPQTGWKSETTDCAETISLMTNGTGTATVTTDYVDVGDGTFTLVNGTFWVINTAGGNSSVVTYSYCDDGYLNSGWGRSLSDVAVGLFAVLLLGATVGFLYMALKEMGVGKL